MAEDAPGTHKTLKDPYGPRWLLWVFLMIAVLQAVIIVATPSKAVDLIVLIVVAVGLLILLILSHRAKRAGSAGQGPEDSTAGE